MDSTPGFQLVETRARKARAERYRGCGEKKLFVGFDRPLSGMAYSLGALYLWESMRRRGRAKEENAGRFSFFESLKSRELLT
jgi:hypothetical protein